jgi:hypothetical protein
MSNGKFDIETVKQIRDQIDQIQRIAMDKFQDHELFNTIDNLARVAGMFADIKVQELDGHVETADPQGYIKGNLSTASTRL